MPALLSNALRGPCGQTMQEHCCRSLCEKKTPFSLFQLRPYCWYIFVISRPFTENDKYSVSMHRVVLPRHVKRAQGIGNQFVPGGGSIRRLLHHDTWLLLKRNSPYLLPIDDFQKWKFLRLPKLVLTQAFNDNAERE